MLPLQEVVRQVRRQRILLGLTQAELARAAGTSQSLVAKLERGRLNPSYEVVRRLLEEIDSRAQAEEPTAGDLMHKDPVWVEPTERLGRALEKMKRHGFSQLPVVEQGQAVGSVSERAILERIEGGEEIETLKHQPVRLAMGPAFPTVDASTRKRVVMEILRDQDAVLVVRGGRLAGVVTKSDLW
ncbi:MAG: CBS domain-containing protein [Thermoplasmatota archaeon]